MRITIYQLLLALAAFAMVVYRTVRFFRGGQSQSFLKYCTIVCIWGMIGIVALFPSVAHFIRIKFGFGDNFNTMIFIAFVMLFVLFFKILAIIEKIESQLTDMVRDESLKKIAKNPASKKK